MEGSAKDRSFPVEQLPEKLQSIIKDFNSEKGFPIAYISAAVLFATSVAIGSTVKLVFPHVGDVYGNLFMAIVGTRGSNKSSPILEAIRPLLILDNQYVRESAAAFREYDRQKAKGEFPEPPVSRRIMVQDITTETLLEKLDENPRGLGLYVDELASQERVRNIIDSCRDNAHSSLHFQRMLAKKGIGVTFRRDHSGEITDVRIVDHKCRTAFSSEILGQPYNAISFNARIDSGIWDEEYGKPVDVQASSHQESNRPSISIGEFLIAEGNSRGHEKDQQPLRQADFLCDAPFCRHFTRHRTQVDRPQNRKDHASLQGNHRAGPKGSNARD